MEFRIIPEQQTPKVPQDFIVNADYLESNKKKFEAYLEFAKSRRTAVGLAANQCDLDGEIFNEFLFTYKNMKTGEWALRIAPKITRYFGMCEEKGEGCLTWVGRQVIVERYRGIDVEYYDMDGKFHSETTKGFDAQIWQHEINHLNGIPEKIVESFYALERIKKPNRNDKCPCGSGIKYKHCCLLLM